MTSTIPERSGGKLIRNGRVDTFVVVLPFAEHSHTFGAENVGQPSFVRDYLHLCAHNLAGLLVELFGQPVLVDTLEIVDNRVVLSHPQIVHGQESELLVGSVVARHETAHRGRVVALTVHVGVQVEGQ